MQYLHCWERQSGPQCSVPSVCWRLRPADQASHKMPDFLTRAERSARMASIRSHDTGLEKRVGASLRAAGIRFRQYDTKLPGRPDFILSRGRIAVFVDSDFWHGWQYPRWKAMLSPYWQAKIEATRSRDRKNTRRLRRMGLTVIRVWGHELKTNPDLVVDRVRQHSPSAHPSCAPLGRARGSR